MRSIVRRGFARSAADVVVMLAQTRLLTGLPAITRAIRTDGATVSAAVSASAARFGSAVAVVDAEGSLSYRELDTEVSRMASTFGPGDRVGIACGNTRRFVIGLAAASRARADAVLIGPRIGAIDHAAVVERQGVGFLLDDDDDDDAPVRVDSGPLRGRIEHARDDTGRGRITVLSSGTTGTPEPTERAPLRIGQAASAASLLAAIGLRPRHPVLLLAPLHHGHGLSLAVACLGVGAPLVLTGGLRMDATLDLAERSGVRVVSGVPAQLLRFVESIESRPRTLRVSRIVSGSARLPQPLVTRLAEHFGAVVIDFFGSTETGTVTVARAAELTAGSVGRPIAGAVIRIVDAAGRPVARATEGRVLASSPLSISRGALPTGDRGYLDAAGRLHLTGRSDSLVVTGGENVSVGQVEDYLLAQPEIADAHVHVVPDERLDAVLAVLVVLRSPATVEELLTRITRDLGRPRTPRTFDIVDTIPRTPTGKARL